MLAKKLSKVCVVILLSDGKGYALHQHLRSIRELDYPVRNISICVIFDQNRSSKSMSIVEEFGSRYPDYDMMAAGCLIPEDTSDSESMHWKIRAKIASRMRQMASEVVRKQKKDFVFFAGCDMIFQRDTIRKLVALDAPISTGVYQARVSNFPVTCSYDRSRKTWGVIPRKEGIYEVDWCGLDCLLVRSDVLDKVDWDGFEAEYYEVGEDAWFCLKANELLGCKVKVDGSVMPLHVNPNGRVAYPQEFRVDIVRYTCPYCSHSFLQNRYYRDIEAGCPSCKQVYILGSFWQDLELVEAVALQQVSSQIY